MNATVIETLIEHLEIQLKHMESDILLGTLSKSLSIDYINQMRSVLTQMKSETVFE